MSDRELASAVVAPTLAKIDARVRHRAGVLGRALRQSCPHLRHPWTRGHVGVLDPASHALLLVRQEHGHGLAFPVLKLDTNRVGVRQPHVRHQRHCPKAIPLRPKTSDQRREHIEAGRLLATARVCSNHSGVTRLVERNCVRKELTMLVEHLLSEGQGHPDQAVEVVLRLLARTISPRSHESILPVCPGAMVPTRRSGTQAGQSPSGMAPPGDAVSVGVA